MKIEDIKKIVSLKKEDISLPLEGMSGAERESLYYSDIADAELASLCH